MSETVTNHPFKEWLRQQRLTHEWAAAALQLSRLTLHRNFTGLRVMDQAVKLKVEALTEGSITALAICGWELDRHQRAAVAA